MAVVLVPVVAASLVGLIGTPVVRLMISVEPDQALGEDPQHGAEPVLRTPQPNTCVHPGGTNASQLSKRCRFRSKHSTNFPEPGMPLLFIWERLSMSSARSVA